MRPFLRSGRAVLVAVAATVLCACGGSSSSDDGGTPSSTPTATATPTMSEPAFAVSHSIVAENVSGRGDVAAAFDGDGFLVASVRGAANGGSDVLVGDRLDRSGARRDPASITIATADDIPDDRPGDPPAFDQLVAALLDGAVQVAWHSERFLGFPTEHAIFARRVEADGRVAAAPVEITSVLSGVGFCQTTIRGPFAGAAVAGELVVLFAEGGACANNAPPIAIPDLVALDPRTDAITYVPVTPRIGVRGRDLVQGLFFSSATVAARENDALIEWFGGETGGTPPFVRGLWIENGAALPVDVGAASAVASDGDGYLVVSTAVDAVDDSRRVIQVARFAPDTHQLGPPATVVADAGDVGRIRLVAFAPDQYLLVHESLADDGSASLEAHRVSTEGSAPTSVSLGSFATGRFGGLATASGGGVALVVYALLDEAGTSFAIGTITAGMR